MTTTLEAPAEPTRIERVEDVPEEVRKEIVELRAAGSTLAELKGKFPALTPDTLRGVLPPMNKREATTRAKSKTATQAAKSAKPVGGKPKTEKSAEPKTPEPRYAADVDELSAQVLAARERIGRAALSEFMGVSQSCVWRWERSRVTPAEVANLKAQVARFGELPQPAEKAPKTQVPSKAELLAQREQVTHLVSAARESKSVGTIHELLGKALAVLDPTDAPTA